MINKMPAYSTVPATPSATWMGPLLSVGLDELLDTHKHSTYASHMFSTLQWVVRFYLLSAYKISQHINMDMLFIRYSIRNLITELPHPALSNNLKLLTQVAA